MSVPRLSLYVLGMTLATICSGAAWAESQPTPISNVPRCERLLALQVPLKVPDFLYASDGEVRLPEEASVWEKCRMAIRLEVELEQESQPDPQLDERAAELHEFYRPRLALVDAHAEAVVQLAHQRQILNAWPLDGDRLVRLESCEDVDEAVAQWFISEREDLGARLDAIRACHREFIASVPQTYDGRNLQSEEVTAGVDPMTMRRFIQFFLMLLIATFIIYRLSDRS